MLDLYKIVMNASTPLLKAVLESRARRGKEDIYRLPERMGVPSRTCPDGKLVWFHAASVGEAQSTLILIQTLHKYVPDAHILVTTGTVTSAELMQSRLPPYAFHQYYPLDHPAWVERFLDHWRPDMVLWMESEIWPNMLREVKRRDIPALLVNARLSERSFRRWKLAGRQIRALLGAFRLFLAQTEEDATYFRALGAENVVIADNLKYSADPLPFDERDLNALTDAVGQRPFWLYASTHDGEEDLACRLHLRLKTSFPGLLTVIVPRHPDRRGAILETAEKHALHASLRTKAGLLPQRHDDIYIVDTLGELGLFYRLAPIACIGRSFSADGGGGHNPIEAAQLGCAVLHGPNVQNLARIYDEMDQAGATVRLTDEAAFEACLSELLKDPAVTARHQEKARRFTVEKAAVLDKTMLSILPWLDKMRGKTNAGKACA